MANYVLLERIELNASAASVTFAATFRRPVIPI
jgi:hypothetical protein